MFELSDLNKYNKRPLQMFLKKNKLKSTGNIDELVEIIENALKENKITNDEYNKWRTRLLREGRKHIYIFGLEEESVKKLRDGKNFEDIKIEKGLNEEIPVNNIVSVK